MYSDCCLSCLHRRNKGPVELSVLLPHLLLLAEESASEDDLKKRADCLDLGIACRPYG